MLTSDSLRTLPPTSTVTLTHCTLFHSPPPLSSPNRRLPLSLSSFLFPSSLFSFPHQLLFFFPSLHPPLLLPSFPSSPFLSTSILSVTSLPLPFSSLRVGRGSPSRARRSARRRIDALGARGVRKCGPTAGCGGPELGRVGGDLMLAADSGRWRLFL